MELRDAIVTDIEALAEIDGVIESAEFIFVEAPADGTNGAFNLHRRRRREKLILPKRLDDEAMFLARQLASGAEEGLAVIAEHDGAPVALLLAVDRPGRDVMELIDLRVDYDFRRQGIGLAMVYRLLSAARDRGRRAVLAALTTANAPGMGLLEKCGFMLSGLDTRWRGNHDLVRDDVTLFWYAETAE